MIKRYKILKEKIKKRLSLNKGETIAETLIATLIVTLSLTMLAGAIVSAAKLNNTVRDEDSTFTQSEVSSSGSVTVKLMKGNTEAARNVVNVDIYGTDNGTYYEYKD